MTSIDEKLECLAISIHELTHEVMMLRQQLNAQPTKTKTETKTDTIKATLAAQGIPAFDVPMQAAVITDAATGEARELGESKLSERIRHDMQEFTKSAVRVILAQPVDVAVYQLSSMCKAHAWVCDMPEVQDWFKRHGRYVLTNYYFMEV